MWSVDNLDDFSKSRHYFKNDGCRTKKAGASAYYKFNGAEWIYNTDLFCIKGKCQTKNVKPVYEQFPDLCGISDYSLPCCAGALNLLLFWCVVDAFLLCA